MQVAQAKQSGVTRFCLRMASMTVEGHALTQASQAVQVL